MKGSIVECRVAKAERKSARRVVRGECTRLCVGSVREDAPNTACGRYSDVRRLHGWSVMVVWAAAST